MTSSKPDLAILAVAAHEHWDATVERAYERRATQIWEYARRLGLDPARAEEVAQESFARLLGLQAARRPKDVDAWIFRVAHNLAMDSHRRGRRIAVGEIELVAPDPDETQRLVLWSQVDRLPERQRAAIYLRYRADLDFAAIASVLQISESGARANVFRGIARLRTWLDLEE